MLTMPKEIVPRQIARGARVPAPSDLRSVRARAGRDLCAVFGAIPNIKGITIGAGAPRESGWLDSLRAPRGPAPRPCRGGLACLLERAAEGVGESPLAGGKGRHLGDASIAASGGRGVVPNRPARAPTGRLVARPGLGIPGADLLHRAVDRLPAWRA